MAAPKAPKAPNPPTVPVVSAAEVEAYCRGEGWSVVGYDLRLLLKPGETARVAVLAKDRRGHFLAISPLKLEGNIGLGIIDLDTAEARFARLGEPAGGRRN